MDKNEQCLQWAMELQSLAQADLTYEKDVYDETGRPDDRYKETFICADAIM